MLIRIGPDQQIILLANHLLPQAISVSGPMARGVARARQGKIPATKSG